MIPLHRSSHCFNQLFTAGTLPALASSGVVELNTGGGSELLYCGYKINMVDLLHEAKYIA